MIFIAVEEQSQTSLTTQLCICSSPQTKRLSSVRQSRVTALPCRWACALSLGPGHPVVVPWPTPAQPADIGVWSLRHRMWSIWFLRYDQLFNAYDKSLNKREHFVLSLLANNRLFQSQKLTCKMDQLWESHTQSQLDLCVKFWSRKLRPEVC